MGYRVGFALFYAYLGEALDDPTQADRAFEQIELSAEAAHAALPHAALFGGIGGLLWALAHLEGRLFDSSADFEHLVAALEQAVESSLHSPRAGANYDVISGLSGLGLIALERRDRGRSRAILGRVLELLLERVEESADGLTWFTPPENLPQHQRETAPHGYYNLGVAHGLPGVIGFLGASYAAGFERSTCARLLEGVLRWLDAKVPAEHPCRFSAWLAHGVDTPPPVPRLAWCYGDLGASLAMWVAARALGDSDREAQALEIARVSTQWRGTQAGVADPALCHGAAGVAHLYNRLYQGTYDTVFADAARHWFGQALDMRVHPDGPGGFKVRRGTSDDGFEWVADACTLSGATGVGLALLGACTHVEPEWDRLLLASIRDHGALAQPSSDGGADGIVIA